MWNSREQKKERKKKKDKGVVNNEERRNKMTVEMAVKENEWKWNEKDKKSPMQGKG